MASGIYLEFVLQHVCERERDSFSDWLESLWNSPSGDELALSCLSTVVTFAARWSLEDLRAEIEDLESVCNNGI